MFKQSPLNQHDSMLEREFFYKKEREAIEKIKKAEKLKAVDQERSTHVNKCSYCGSGMEQRSLEEVNFLYCSQCQSLHMGLNDLDGLNVRHKLRNFISDLLISGQEKNKSA